MVTKRIGEAVTCWRCVLGQLARIVYRALRPPATHYVSHRDVYRIRPWTDAEKAWAIRVTNANIGRRT